MEEIPYYIASFLCIKNLFEVVCIMHNDLHKVKLVMILIFLVFVKNLEPNFVWLKMIKQTSVESF